MNKHHNVGIKFYKRKRNRKSSAIGSKSTDGLSFFDISLAEVFNFPDYPSLDYSIYIQITFKRQVTKYVSPRLTALSIDFQSLDHPEFLELFEREKFLLTNLIHDLGEDSNFTLTGMNNWIKLFYMPISKFVSKTEAYSFFDISKLDIEFSKNQDIDIKLLSLIQDIVNKDKEFGINQVLSKYDKRFEDYQFEDKDLQDEYLFFIALRIFLGLESWIDPFERSTTFFDGPIMADWYFGGYSSLFFYEYGMPVDFLNARFKFFLSHLEGDYFNFLKRLVS